MGSRALGFVTGAVTLVAALTLACGAPDPGAYTLEQGHGPSITGPDNDSAAPIKLPDAGSPHDADFDSTVAKDAAKSKDAQKETSAVEDAGPSVFGNTTYSGMPVAESASTYHQKMGGPNNPGYGMACLSCHGGSSKTTTVFLFAGSIYTDADGGTGAATTEVRVTTGKKTGTSTYSDSDGNFWSIGTAPYADTGLAGARNATSEQTMTQPLTSGDCNSCHDGKAQPIMHLP